jgi:hypothetical protein
VAATESIRRDHRVEILVRDDVAPHGAGKRSAYVFTPSCTKRGTRRDRMTRASG